MAFRTEGKVQRVAVLSEQRVSLLRLFGRAGLSVGLMVGFAWALADRWAKIDASALADTLSRLGIVQWAAALGFTALSFWAVGRYDAVLHAYFKTSTPARTARRAGICAIAVSQTLGLGLISGAILRWRMLPDSTLWQATRLTAAVALSFLAGWAVVTATVLILLPDAPFRTAAVLVLSAATCLAALSIWGPRLPGPMQRLRWPNGFILSRLVGLCALDTLAAALAFHAVLPDGLELPFSTLLPAFLLALGAGLALGTPGGMGAFEVTLIALLPLGENPDLLAAILAWRLVYYAVPALCGAILAILGPGRQCQPPRLALPLPGYAQAETGLCHQREVSLATLAGQLWLLGRRHHTLIAVMDPIGARRYTDFDRALTNLRHQARMESRLPVIYKAGARLAARARTRGFVTRRIGWAAWIFPATYRLCASSRSGLRRKLRRAEAAGIRIAECAPSQAPWSRLDQIAAEWAQAHGGERGFSMGRHEHAYLARQRLYIAWLGDEPIAYASFHTARDEWALDVMRHRTHMPDGTMHSLVQAAIADAAAIGLPRLSLAAVTDGAVVPGDRISRLIAALAPQTAQTGLYRFKSSFAPAWTPLYLIAQNPVGLVLAGLSLWRAITRPPPLMRPDMPEIEQDDAEYGFALDAAPWHIAVNR